MLFRSNEDPWHMKDLQKYLGSYNYFTDKEEMMKRVNILMKHPCVFDYFNIPPVPKELYDSYQKARDAKAFQRDKIIESIDQKMIGKVVTYNLMTRWDELSGATKESKFKRPTLKMMEEFVFSNPNTGDKLVGLQTLSNWVADVKRLIKK